MWIYVDLFILISQLDFFLVLIAERLGISVVKREPRSHAIVFKSADIRVTVEGKQLSGPEAYSLTVDPAKEIIEIRSREPQGAFYGAMTLLNLKDEDHRVGTLSDKTEHYNLRKKKGIACCTLLY